MQQLLTPTKYKADVLTDVTLHSIFLVDAPVLAKEKDTYPFPSKGSS